MKPATPLPWNDLYDCTAYGIGADGRAANVKFAVHAANAYPRLVEALRQYVGAVSSVNDPNDFSVKVKDEGHYARDLLRDLGEDK